MFEKWFKCPLICERKCTLYESLKAAWNELSGLFFKRLWVHGGLSELNISESTLHIFHQNRIFLIFAERRADLEHFTLLLLSCCCLCDIQRHACKFSRSVCDTFPTICNRVKRLTGRVCLASNFHDWIFHEKKARNLMKFNIFVPFLLSD